MLKFIQKIDSIRSRYQCQCGAVKEIRHNDVDRKKIISCGCFRKSKWQAVITKHGMCKGPIYTVWASMKSRCNNKKEKRYPDYGGRGISYQESWGEYINFYNDMYPSFKEGLTLDRIDNHGNYTKDNCKWSDITEQANNKRNNRMVYTPFGEMTLPNAARHYGVNVKTFRSRMEKTGFVVL